MEEGEWIRRRGQKRGKEKKWKKGEEKGENRKGQFRHFTTSIQQMKLFCQAFSKMVSAPLRSRSTEGVRVKVVFEGARALPNRPVAVVQTQWWM
jgi:hypothetical protein